MKQRFLLIIIALAVTLTAGAQTYHDAAIYHLKGNVKMYKQGTYVDKRTFAQNGKETTRNAPKYVYDSNGYPIRTTDGKKKFFYTDGLLTKVERKTDNGQNAVDLYLYDNDGVLSMSMTQVDGKPLATFSYKNVRSDSHGNLVSYKWVSESFSDGNCYTMDGTMASTIEYWPATTASKPKAAPAAKPAAPAASASAATVSGTSWMDLWQKFHMVKFYLEEYGDYIDGRRLNPKKRIAESFFLNFVGDRRGVQWNDRPDGKCYTYAGSVDGSILHITTSQTGPNPERKCDITLRLLGFEKDKFTFVENGKKYYVFKHY